MANLIHLLQTYGVLIVFATVLVEQIGLPIPAFPVLILAGALAVDGTISWPLCLLVSLAACLISDVFWFRAGRHYGKRILKVLCQISLSPDYCVSQTEDNFRRHGPKALLVAKFIPGFNTIAPPLAGAMGTSTARFLSFSVAGALIWSGAGIGIGAYFHASIDKVLDVLSTMGTTALMVLAGLLALFVLFKYWERRRFQQGMQIERIGIDELFDLIHSGQEPVIIDARSATAQQLEPPIPGALIFNAHPPEHFVEILDKDRHIVVYCSCPNDVTAAQVAKQLHAQGFRRARPLHGGLDAWNARGADAPVVGAA
ncbi:MAG: DedA family protein/thiosulfate sulfurtransferase GlpE [Pseudomonadota bacterium]